MKLPQESKPRDATAKILNRVDDSDDDSGGNCRLQIPGGVSRDGADDRLGGSKMGRKKSGTSKVVREDSDFEEETQVHNQNKDTTKHAKESRSKVKHDKRRAELHVEDDSLVPSKKNERASRATILKISADDISVPRERDGSSVPTHPKLSSRACPKLIFQANEKYTVVQRGAVKDMGFQHILHMKVERVPTYLAYWVLDNFNANSSELTLTNGRSIPVDEDHVHLVFGFPKGGRKIQRRRNVEVYCI
ncbi:hypothetical protein C2S52_013969 [Perilla frutescens var. hirtella]|nr:hypothetical protein C2S52_013969 [Perilla frutescens var. hirtella]